METYRNYGGNSGISSYEIGDGSIKVRFSDGSVYEYTSASAGESNIIQMIKLAKSGQGLNSFIMRNVRLKYAR